MSLRQHAQEDAERIAEVDGEQVTYSPAEGVPFAVRAFVSGGLLKEMETAQSRINHKSIVLAIARVDVPQPNRNGDKVTVPGEWLNESADQTLRVASFEGHPSSPGFWLVRCS